MKVTVVLLVVLLQSAHACAQDLKPIEPGRLPPSLRERNIKAFETPHATILAPSGERAESLAKLVEPAAEHFKKVFRKEAPRVLLAAMEKPIDDQWCEVLRCRTMLPWFPEDNYRETLGKRIRQQLKQQSPKATEEEIEAKVKDVLARAESRGVKQTYDQTLSHELGHNWFTNTFWPNIHGRSDGIHYGSPADDWLDEAAAISLETPEMKANRYRNLPGHFAADRIVPLEKLFVMEHPKRPAVGASKEPSGKPVLGSGDKSKLVAVEAFYSQTLSVMDFMNEKARKAGLLAAIAESQVKGQHMEEWLRTQGPKWNLPRTVAELEKEWRTWLDAKLKSPKAKENGEGRNGGIGNKKG